MHAAITIQASVIVLALHFRIILTPKPMTLALISVLIMSFNKPWFVGLVGLWFLRSLSIMFQLNRGGQVYWWRKLEYPEKTTDLS